MGDAGLDYFDFVLSGIIGIILVIVGVTGNALSVVVLSRKEMRSPTSYILQGLAFFDTLVLLSFLMKDALPALAPNTSSLLYYKREIHPRMIPILYPIKLIATTGSTWCTVAVTIERYIAICKPAQARALSTQRRAKLCNAIVFVFSFCFSLPRFFDFKVTEKLNPATNETVVQLRKYLLKNDIYMKVYNVWLSLLVRFVIPFFILAVLNGAICVAIRAANRKRVALKRRVISEMKLSLMLMCVVAVFFLCNVFTFARKICYFLQLSNGYLNVSAVFLIMLNSSVNFIIYCIFSRKFRRVCSNVFCDRSSDGPQPKIGIKRLSRRRNADKPVPLSSPEETECSSTRNATH